MASTISRILCAAALCASALQAFAAPSPKAVEDAVRAGNWAQAESMLIEVTREKPDSARGWYFLAQTEEKLGKIPAAQSALQRASRLQPDLRFASPGAVAAMRERLTASAAATAAAASLRPVPVPAPVKEDGHPILWTLAILALVGGIGYLIYRLTRRESSLASGYGSAPAFSPAAPVGSYGYGAPAGSTVIVNQGGGSNLLSTMILADAISHSHHHGHDSSPSHSAPSSASSYASSAPASPSSFDLGGGGSSWDSGSSFDSGSSSSSSSSDSSW